ncbi:MAG: adenylate/guanylate cyclase domain-containing protein, partial [Hyphomicrobiaceae bacterium]
MPTRDFGGYARPASSVTRNTASRMLRRADAEAEGLLGLVRMAVALALGAALLLAINAPARPDSDVLDRQILLGVTVIASYFFVGLAASLIVRAGHYRPWMAWITAFLDVVLICSSVWLSTVNSGTSSLFAFIFPSALMVPLMLTFGSLRFRPLIQVAITLLTGALCLVILFSDPLSDPDGGQILQTLGLVYGVPPNLVRIVMIMSTGFVIALAVWRARRLLERVAREAEQRINLTRFLPHGIAHDMTDESMQRLRAGRHATVALMFIDIRGFTHLAETMSPEAASQLLGEYRSHIMDVVEGHGGIVDKFIGDGALILFGLSPASDNTAGRAVNAATALMARIAEWNQRRSAQNEFPIEVGIGLHLGDVVIGAIGDQRRLEFTVIGDEVNVAARVEQSTKAMEFKLL